MAFCYGVCPSCGATYDVDCGESRGYPTVFCNGGLQGDCRRVEVQMKESGDEA